MLSAYIIIAFFIAWVWIDYYRLIDIYEKEQLKYILFTFFFGGLSAFLVLNLQEYLFIYFHFELTGNWLNDFLYSTFKIGLVEEIAKAIPFVIVLFLFEKQLNEPIDYIAFICFSALGFAAVENVIYFYNHGSSIISGRAILSTVGHMFNSAILGYGFILVRFRDKRPAWLILLVFLLLASLAHGFYNFWLLYEETKSFGWIITVLYFLFTLSIFSTMLNNSLNISSFFTYKYVVKSNKVASRLLLYYLLIFIFQGIVLTIETDFYNSMGHLTAGLFVTGFIVVITSVRLTRFKLIKDRWEKIKFELPFSVYHADLEGSIASSSLRFNIKGEGFCDAHISIFYHEHIYLNPLSASSSYLRAQRLAYMEEKLFLDDDLTVYLIRLYLYTDIESYETMVIKAKKTGTTEINDKYQILGLYQINNIELIKNPEQLSINDLTFIEWVYLVPMEEK
jgi:RsiW-degrading membrane proteinase PrsW (M82 family)